MPDRFSISAGKVVPLNAAPVENGAVIVSNGRIERILPRSDLPSDIPTESYPDGILLPAFVNAHTHLVYTAFRGLADDADFHTWIMKHIIPLGIDRREDECRQSARLGIKECFRHGITCLGEDHYTPWGRDAMSEMGMKGVHFLEVFGIRSLNLTRSVKRDRAMIEDTASRATERLRTGVAPHAPYSVAPAVGRMAAEISEKLNLPIAVHVAETRAEIELFLRGTGPFAIVRRLGRIPKPDGKRTPLTYFDDLGLLTKKTLIIHGVHLSDADLDIAAERGCTLVTCPTSNAKLGAGIARVGAWVHRDIPVCIATDSPASGETYDLFEEMRRFVLMQRALTGETDTFPAESVLRMVTTNPARALGMEDMVGDLRIGSCADMILVTPDQQSRSRYRDIYQTLLWDINAQKISRVWSDGREIWPRVPPTGSAL